MVRKGGFEPPRLSAPPPQDGVSASSTTSARDKLFLRNPSRSAWGNLQPLDSAADLCLLQPPSRHKFVAREPMLSCPATYCNVRSPCTLAPCRVHTPVRVRSTVHHRFSDRLPGS